MQDWQQTLFVKFKASKFICLHGNVHDEFISYDEQGFSLLPDFIKDFLSETEYEIEMFACNEFDQPLKKFKEAYFNANGKVVFIVQNADLLSCENKNDDNILTNIREYDSQSKIIFLFDSVDNISEIIKTALGYCQIRVPKPDLATRRKFLNMCNIFDDSVATAAQGLTLYDLRNNISPSRSNADNIYKFKNGVASNPWEDLNEDSILNLEKKLNKKVIGQQNVIAKVCQEINFATLGITKLWNNHKPKATFFFAGPTGVGKTFLCQQLAKELFGSEDALIRIDCNTLKLEQDSAKLLGAPPGYIGYGRTGILKQVQEAPFSIVLLDEIEKAHPDIFDIVMNIIDGGTVTDSDGQVINFENTMIIFTSNIGAAANNIQNAIETHFKNINRPEFYGRIKNKICLFNNTNNNKMPIIKAKISEIQNIKFSDAAIEKICTLVENTNYGGRDIAIMTEEIINNCLIILARKDKGILKKNIVITNFETDNNNNILSVKYILR